MSKDAPKPPRKKIVVVGDGAVGKTSLLTVYWRGRFEKWFRPCVLEQFVTEEKFGEQWVELSIWDTGGQEEYERLRPLTYHKADLVLICYTPEYEDSLENVIEKWAPEVSHFCPGVPMMLVGCRSDVREDPATLARLQTWRQKMVPVEECAEVAKKISASAHIECSARFDLGVREVFETATQILFTHVPDQERSKEGKCLIL